MNLKHRIDELERCVADNRPHTPALFFWKQQETLEQAKEGYKQRYGYSLPKDAPVIEFVCCDMTKAGNGRELSKEEFQSLSEGR